MLIVKLRILIILLSAMIFFIDAAGQSKDTVPKAAAADTAKLTPPLSLTGSVDGYYRSNFSNPKIGSNNHTSFTNSQNSFELGMASLRADHSFGNAGATVDLGFGRRAEEYSYNDAAHPTLFAVMQAFISYKAASWIKFTLGKWGTHIGYE